MAKLVTNMRCIASQVVERCTLIEEAFTQESWTPPKMPNKYYAIMVLLLWNSLTHGVQAMDNVIFIVDYFYLISVYLNEQSTHTITVSNQVCYPPSWHKVMWHRFVNTRGGLGRNIFCDLYNEHVNKLLKMIANMGSNPIKEALQRSARSVSTLQAVC